MSTLNEDVCAFMIISRRILLRMRYVSDKSRGDNQDIVCSTPPPEIRAVCEIMWRNMIEPDRPQMTILYKRRTKCAICISDN